METYYLITNVANQTYWSYLGTKDNTTGIHARMVKKYGNIYINRSGGWFNDVAVKKILKTVDAKSFPQDPVQ